MFFGCQNQYTRVHLVHLCSLGATPHFQRLIFCLDCVKISILANSSWAFTSNMTKHCVERRGCVTYSDSDQLYVCEKCTVRPLEIGLHRNMLIFWNFFQFWPSNRYPIDPHLIGTIFLPQLFFGYPTNPKVVFRHFRTNKNFLKNKIKNFVTVQKSKN